MALTPEQRIGKDLEISRMLTVSTAHITGGDSDLLADPYAGIVSYSTPYGWLVFTEIMEDDCGFDPASPALKKILALAKDHGCEWVRFDESGPEIDGLETFEW
jgi:hypothetical protein